MKEKTAPAILYVWPGRIDEGIKITVPLKEGQPPDAVEYNGVVFTMSDEAYGPPHIYWSPRWLYKAKMV